MLELVPLHKAQTFEESIQRQTVSRLLDHINDLLRAYRTAGESAAYEEGLSTEEIKGLLESNTEQLRTALYGAVAAWATSAPEVAADAQKTGELYIPHAKKREIVKVVAGVAKRRGAREFKEGESTAYQEIRKGSGPPRTQEEIYAAVSSEAQRRNPDDSPLLAMSKYLETEEGQRVYQHYRDAPAGR